MTTRDLRTLLSTLWLFIFYLVFAMLFFVNHGSALNRLAATFRLNFFLFTATVAAQELCVLHARAVFLFAFMMARVTGLNFFRSGNFRRALFRAVGTSCAARFAGFWRGRGGEVVRWLNATSSPAYEEVGFGVL